MKESLEEFYNGILGIEPPWEVVSISRDSESRIVTAQVHYKKEISLTCPKCKAESKLYDHRKRRWRHLDSCNHKTIIEALVPRIRCSEHKVVQLPVAWAEKNSRFTAEFEMAVLIWLKEDPISTVANNFDISWDEVDGMMKRAVKRGLERRKKSKPAHIGIDETAFQKRHEYVTVILDKDKDVVIDVLDDRKAKTLNNWLKQQDISDLSTLKSISMDMWDPFINAVKSNFENAHDLIAFDRFHVAQHLGKAVDKVRAQENRVFKQAGKDNPLTRTKYQWLRNSHKTDNRATKRKEFLQLTQLNLKTARAWRIKEAASMLWNYTYMGAAVKEWKKLLGWISRCRLKPMIKVGKMIRRYFWGILNAIKLKINNSMLEAKNSKIQKIKRTACGFRNRERFKNSILFHLGGLDIMPVPTQ
ncbi:MAG: ISL3 family transposase [Lentisphaerae bacterium]|nr:ISL3 family transposase [Lentisphaerota bacterium]